MNVAREAAVVEYELSLVRRCALQNKATTPPARMMTKAETK